MSDSRHDPRRRRKAARVVAAGGALAAAAVLVAIAVAPGSRTSARTASVPVDTRPTHRVAHRRHGSGSVHHHSRGALAVPILMYHVIARPPRDAPFPGLYVLPAEFAAQMRGLARAGYRADTLDQVRNYWLTGVPLPAGKPIVITFDNGYRTQYTKALPVLERLGWVADENIQLTGLPPSQGGLLRREVKALIRDGWEVDTQGVSHADLVRLDPASLRYQVADARAVLLRRFRVRVNWFCYPSGDYDAAVIAAVKAAGYVGSTTVEPGWAKPSEDPFRLPRLRVPNGTSPSRLLELIAGSRTDPAPPPSYR